MFPSLLTRIFGANTGGITFAALTAPIMVFHGNVVGLPDRP